MVISACICLGEEDGVGVLLVEPWPTLVPASQAERRWLSLASQAGLAVSPCARGVAGWEQEGPRLINVKIPEILHVIHRAILLTASSASPDSKQLTSQAPGKGLLAAIRVTLTSFVMHSHAPRCSRAVEGQLLPAQESSSFWASWSGGLGSPDSATDADMSDLIWLLHCTEFFMVLHILLSWRCTTN